MNIYCKKHNIKMRRRINYSHGKNSNKTISYYCPICQEKTIKQVIIPIIFITLLLLLLPMASSEVQTLGTFKQGQCISLKQTCANCTYNNVTSVIAPNSEQMTSNSEMTRSGSEYNLTFCSTGQQGKYIVNGIGDVDGVDTIWAYDFLVTPSGQSNLLGLFIIVIVIIYGIAFIGFFGRNVWVTVLGGMAMIILGLFTLNNGIDIYRSFITEALSFTTIGLGAFFAIYAGIDLIQENL